MSGKRVMEKTIFISYSHEDRVFLDELSTFLHPLRHRIDVKIWDDTMIKAGQLWRNEIEQVLGKAIAGVLMVSPPFLASDFIRNVELPALLKRAQNQKCKILIIIVSTSLFTEYDFSAYHTVNDPDSPLDQSERQYRGKVWLELATRIKEISNMNENKSSEDQEDTTDETETIFIEAIKYRFPDLSDSEAENLASLLLLDVVDALEKGHDLAVRRVNNEGIHEITKFFIPRNSTNSQSEENA